MKKSNNLNRVLEFFWLTVCILTAIMGLYTFMTKGFDAAYMFFIMAILALLLYLARHSLRMKEKKSDE